MLVFVLVLYIFKAKEFTLKGPKLEIFVAEFFAQTKPVRVDDLETDSTVSEDAGTEPRTVATLALTDALTTRQDLAGSFTKV